MCPQTRTQCLFTNWLGNLSKILKVLRPFLYLSRLTLTLLTQIFWHLWFNENTPPLHCPPPTREPQLPIWFKSLFNIFLWQIKKFKHFIPLAVMKLLDKPNSFLYLLLTIVQFTTLKYVFLDRYLLFLTWSTLATCDFPRTIFCNQFLLLPKITHFESSDLRQFSIVPSYRTKHHRHHNKITIWIKWYNMTLYKATLRAAWWTSPASWWSPASSPRSPGPPARGSGTDLVSQPLCGD